jgi:hypothetical protein
LFVCLFVCLFVSFVLIGCPFFELLLNALNLRSRRIEDDSFAFFFPAKQKMSQKLWVRHDSAHPWDRPSGYCRIFARKSRRRLLSLFLPLSSPSSNLMGLKSMRMTLLRCLWQEIQERLHSLSRIPRYSKYNTSLNLNQLEPDLSIRDINYLLTNLAMDTLPQFSWK